ARLGTALRIDRARMRLARDLLIDVADGVRHGDVVAAADAALGAHLVDIRIAGTYPGERLPLE
ncbi:MAG TPA: hypothetical protein VMT18_00815, partial [Planctomycetota bacterium]|nr:hypothetical protein [Planctomycetota bacterium]